jgi:hypothetical protein
MSRTSTTAILLMLMLASLPLSSRAADVANAPRASLSLTNTVDAKTTFRVSRRRSDNNHWDSGSAYAYAKGVALLRALEASKPWDGRSHAAAYGMLHAHTPGIEITIDWSRTKKDRKTRSVALCYGIRLFWYGDSVYQIPEASYGLVDRLFPKNRSGYAPAPNRRPRFVLGTLAEFDYLVCAPPASPAAVGEARR